MWTLLIRSRIFVEKYIDALEYVTQALVKFPGSKAVMELKARAEGEYAKETKRIQEISTLETLASDKKY